MEQPNYYSIIPANVRYDKRLKANEKLLYGEITSLANTKGYCYASNGYFAELYDVKERAVQVWILNLKNMGYIRVEISENNTKRKIFITDILQNINDVGVHKKTPTPAQKDTPTPAQKDTHNNTSINNKLNILDWWNSQKIIMHKDLTPDIDKALDKVIKKIGFEKLQLAIVRYAKAYHDNSFYFKHKWTLLKFLNQGNGYTEWLDDGGMFNNYSPQDNTGQPKASASAVPNSDSTDDYIKKIQEMRGET